MTRSVFALATITLWSTFAWAECAWVLWTMSHEGTRPKYSFYRATQTLPECENLRSQPFAEFYDRMSRRFAAEPGSPLRRVDRLSERVVMLVFKDGRNVAETFECWPDTLDPRK